MIVLSELIFKEKTVTCRKSIYSVSFILVLVFMCGVGRADVTVAEDLLVDLRPEDFLYGAGVTTWPIAKWDGKKQ